MTSPMPGSALHAYPFRLHSGGANGTFYSLKMGELGTMVPLNRESRVWREPWTIPMLSTGAGF